MLNYLRMAYHGRLSISTYQQEFLSFIQYKMIQIQQNQAENLAE